MTKDRRERVMFALALSALVLASAWFAGRATRPAAVPLAARQK